MYRLLLPFLLVGLVAASSSCTAHENSFGFAETRLDPSGLPGRIAFGSCADQDRPQPILDRVVERRPDLFIYLGDNVYGDTEDMDVLREKYRALARREEFARLRRACPLIATWDDHDYGANDAGRDYPMKRESREIFLDFWGVPATSSRRRREGIYHDHVFRDGDRTLQIILLDTRTFRDPLMANTNPPVHPFKNDYRPNLDASSTLLGDDQWAWLEERLTVPADLRVIASSIQFGHSYNGWESWTNLPHERRRMLDLITRTRANGVIFISGDVHWGEMSLQPVVGGYPLLDVTSSGINNDWDSIEPNERRVGPPVRDHNFGEMRIDWTEDDPKVTLVLVDANGTVRTSREVRFSELRFEEDPEADR